METNQILNANLLDILFDGRNKDYGAYELRKNYNARMNAALLTTLVFITILVLVKIFNDSFTPKNPVVRIVESKETFLSKAPKKEKKIIEIPIKKQTSNKKIKSVIFTKPVISKETNIPTPPDMKQIEIALIDTKAIDGDIFSGITPPREAIEGPAVIGNPSSDKPASEKPKDDAPLKAPEIQASFPGGNAAWQKYLTRKIESQLDDPDDNDFGTVSIRFVVDTNGRVSNVTALNMINTTLAEIAVNAIRKGPDWLPAKQNGHYVKAYRTQPVTLTRPY